MIKKAQTITEVIQEIDNIEVTPECIKFPTEIFPKDLESFIKETCNGAGFSIDFLSVSILSVFASIYGRRFYTEVTNTWKTTPIFWFALVGSPGTKKSHPLKLAVEPLNTIDIDSKIIYDEQMNTFNEYNDLSADEKKSHEKIIKPNFKQLVVDDATIEALYYVHEINRGGIMLYKDELIGWIKGMGQYKSGKGDEMEKYLSMFDGGPLKKNRVGQEPLILGKTNMNVVGTVQPEVLSKIPKDNGFLYRFLFTNADRKIKRATSDDVSKEIINGYFNKIKDINSLISSIGDEPELYEMDSLAKKIRIETENYLCDIQSDENTEPIILSYCEKLKTYSPRFGLLLALIENSYPKDNKYQEITAKNMKDSRLLVEYFLSTAKNLFFDSQKSKEIADINSTFYGKTIVERIILLNNKKIKAKLIAVEVEKSIQYVYRIINEYKKTKK